MMNILLINASLTIFAFCLFVFTNELCELRNKVRRLENKLDELIISIMRGEIK